MDSPSWDVQLKDDRENCQHLKGAAWVEGSGEV
jgi:hypothetical protein